MNNIEIFGVPYLKKGSGIHIKKKNRGKFTEYCGGEVTDECILKAKKSKNPTLRKRATFALNARAWKHLVGGPINTLNTDIYRPTIKKVLGLSTAEPSFEEDKIRSSQGSFQGVLENSAKGASDFMSNWYAGRKKTGKFYEELAFIEDRAKVPTLVVGQLTKTGGATYNGGQKSAKVTVNPAVQKTLWGEDGRHRSDYVSRLIHEMAHNYSMFNKYGYNTDKSYEVSPTLKKLQSYMGDSFRMFPLNSEDTENAVEYYPRLMQMREAMGADPTRTDYTEKELNYWLNKFGLPTGERGVWMMNNLVYNTPITNDIQPKAMVAKYGIKLLPK